MIERMHRRQMLVRIVVVHEHYCEEGDHRWKCYDQQCIRHLACKCAPPGKCPFYKGKLTLYKPGAAV